MPVFYNPEEAAISDLQKILLRAVPDDENGHKTISNLARHLKLSRWAVQQWISKNKISPDRAKQVAALSEGRVSTEDLEKFFYSA